MGCGCSTNGYGNGNIQPSNVNYHSVICNNRVTDWNKLQQCEPENPLALIANATLDGVQGVFMGSTNFVNDAVTWNTPNININVLPDCKELRSDDEQKVADARQWNFLHKTAMLSGVPIELNSAIFLRGGIEWRMIITMDMSGNEFTDIEISFFENAMTLGNCHEEIPVVSFTRSSPAFGGSDVELIVTLKEFGKFRMGMRLLNGNDYFFKDFLWIVVP